MKKGCWKVYQVDGMYAGIAARSMNEAIEFSVNELDCDRDEICCEKVDTKNQCMAYSFKDLKNKRHKKSDCTWDGEPAITLTLKKALKNELKVAKHKGPFVLCVTY